MRQHKEGKTKTISQILGARIGIVVSVSPTESVHYALQLMAEHEVGALLVIEHGGLVGILSERDYARKVVLKDKLSQDTRVREIMVDRVICATLEMSVGEAMAIMIEYQIRHLPVLDDIKDVVGIVSMRDLVEETITEQTFVIRQLEHYITM